MRPRTSKNFTAFCLIALLVLTGTASGEPLQLTPLEINILQIASTPAEAQALAEGGAGQPEVVLVGLALPADFDPTRPTPILYTSVTGDPYRSNLKEMEVYRARALARGWIVLTGQPHPWPARERDTVLGRRASAWAAFRTLEECFPGSHTWPTAFAGFSGGSKMTQLLAGDSLARGRTVIGAWMSGCNEDHTATIRDEYHPDENALWNIPYFLSSGKWDRVSTRPQMRAVQRSLENHGARHLRFAGFKGKHAYYLPHLDEALAWFETFIPPAAPAPTP